MINIKVNEESIAILTFDIKNRSENFIDNNFLSVLETMVNEITKNSEIRGLILTSSKGQFPTGFDIEMISGFNNKEQCLDFINFFHKILRKIETWERPSVAAIDSSLFNAGLEMCLACNHIILLNKKTSKVGFPEMQFGLMPGGGATQRLSRMLGVKSALPLLLEGKILSIEETQKLGIIDELVENEKDLINSAVTFIQKNEKILKLWDQRNFKIPGGDVHSPAGYHTFSTMCAKLMERTYGNYLSQKYILSAVYEGLQLPFDQGQCLETKYFTQLVFSTSTKNMIRTFSRAEKIQNGLVTSLHSNKDLKGEINEIVLVGNDQQAVELAVLAAYKGIDVCLIDLSSSKCCQYSNLEDHADLLVNNKDFLNLNKEDVLKRISVKDTIEDNLNCSMVVEIINESITLKAKQINEIEKATQKETVIVSVSYFGPLDQLSAALDRTKNFVGLNFLPASFASKVVEIILIKKSGNGAIEMVYNFAKRLGKIPVLVNDGPGFFSSRVLIRYFLEGVICLCEGVSPSLIENSGKMIGMSKGPLALADDFGLELIHFFLSNYMSKVYEEKTFGKLINSLDLLTNQLGRKGKVNSKGFYDYLGDDGAQKWGELEKYFPTSKEQPDHNDICQRFLLVQSLEAMQCLSENIIEVPIDCDIASVFGWNFPGHMGGVIGYIEKIGVKQFAMLCARLEKSFETRYTLPKNIKDIASQEVSLYDLN